MSVTLKGLTFPLHICHPSDPKYRFGDPSHVLPFTEELDVSTDTHTSVCTCMVYVVCVGFVCPCMVYGMGVWLYVCIYTYTYVRVCGYMGVFTYMEREK